METIVWCKHCRIQPAALPMQKDRCMQCAIDAVSSQFVHPNTNLQEREVERIRCESNWIERNKLARDYLAVHEGKIIIEISVNTHII